MIVATEPGPDLDSSTLLGGLLDTLATHLVLWVTVLFVFAALMMGVGYKMGQWREQERRERQERAARRVEVRRRERPPVVPFRPKHRDVSEDHTAAIKRNVRESMVLRRLRSGDAAGLDHWPTQGYRGPDND